MTGNPPRIVSPGVCAEIFGRLRDHIEHPCPLTRADVKRLHSAGRVAWILQTIGNRAPNDDEIPVDDRRRRHLNVLVANLASEINVERHRSASPERYVR